MLFQQKTLQVFCKTCKWLTLKGYYVEILSKIVWFLVFKSLLVYTLSIVWFYVGTTNGLHLDSPERKYFLLLWPIERITPKITKASLLSLTSTSTDWDALVLNFLQCSDLYRIFFADKEKLYYCFRCYFQPVITVCVDFGTENNHIIQNKTVYGDSSLIMHAYMW